MNFFYELPLLCFAFNGANADLAPSADQLLGVRLLDHAWSFERPIHARTLHRALQGLQSTGSAGSFGMGAVLILLLNECLASWTTMLCSPVSAFIVLPAIKETSYEDE